MKRHIAFVVFLISALASYRLQAQKNKNQQNLKVTATFATGAFPLVQAAKAAPIFIDAQDAEVVQIAAEAF